ncbi:MAG: helicase-associated domain-containing protein [Sphaerobacter sp.]|nr:helicase-associated domain-containing protein [Sphaerobacter sp.]
MRNLLGRLLDRPPRSLAAIAQFWDVELRGWDAHADIGHLYRVMTEPWSFALAWQQLTTLERAILEALAGDDAAATLETIAARVAAPAEAVLPALRRLYRAGLLAREQPPEAAGLPPAPERFFLPRELGHLTQRLRAERARGLPLQQGAAELLEWFDDQELAAIAQHLGYRVIPAVAIRADLVAYVTPRIGNPDVIRATVRALDPTAARLWRWLTEREGVADPLAARQELGLALRTLRQALQTLGRRGLLWRGYDADGALRAVVPDIVRQPAPPPAVPPPPLVPVEPALVEVPEWSPVFTAAWDLLTLLREVAAGRARWRRGGASAASLRPLAPRLWLRSGDLPPTGYVPFLLWLAEAQGLLAPAGGGLVPDRLRPWTRLDFAAQMRQLVARWLEAAEWPEGAEREALQVWGGDWPGFRRRLLDALDTLDSDCWYTLESVTARFAATTPGALGAHFTAAASAEPGVESPEARRQAVIRLAAAVTLTTAGAWLGLVEVARAQRRGTVLRVRPDLGWLRDASRPAPEEPPLGPHPLAVQPTGELLLLHPSPRRVWALSAFAALERLDRVAIYRLTRESVEAGLAAGLTLERMVQFLERESGAPLPPNVAYQLQEWVRAYRRVRLRRAVLLAPDDRASLAELEAALRASGLRVERLSGERLLVLLPADDEAAVERLEATLRELGRTPQWPGGTREG